MSLGIIRVQLDGPLKFTLGDGPVTVVIICDVSERDMRLGQTGIDFYSFQRGDLCLWHRLVWSQHSSSIRGAQEIISVSYAAVSEREVRIFFNRLLIILKRLLHPLPGPLVIVKTPFEIKLVSLVTLGVVF